MEHPQAWKNTQNLLCCWPLKAAGGRSTVLFVARECGRVVCLGERLQGDDDTAMPLEKNMMIAR